MLSVPWFSPSPTPQPSPSSGRYGDDRPPVILIPGMCGSRLRTEALTTWPCTVDPFRSFDLMHWREEPLQADAVIDRWDIYGLLHFTTGYGRLRDVLTTRFGYRLGHDLFEFAYDWRQDCRRSAAALQTQVARWRPDGGPVVVLAHSMGGLVARYWIERLGGAAQVRHLVLFGSPGGGTPFAFEWLVQGVPFLPWLSMGLRRKLAALLQTMPSMYQLLPRNPFVAAADGSPIDIFAERDWLPDRFHPLLDDALAFHAELGERCSVPALCIAGTGTATTTRAVVAGSGTARWENIVFERAEVGDGMVPAASATLPGAESHLVACGHEDLLCDDRVWHWLMPRLFERGTEAGRWRRDTALEQAA